jgi:hypothetical protein
VEAGRGQEEECRQGARQRQAAGRNEGGQWPAGRAGGGRGGRAVGKAAQAGRQTGEQKQGGTICMRPRARQRCGSAEAVASSATAHLSPAATAASMSAARRPCSPVPAAMPARPRSPDRRPPSMKRSAGVAGGAGRQEERKSIKKDRDESATSALECFQGLHLYAGIGSQSPPPPLALAQAAACAPTPRLLSQTSPAQHLGSSATQVARPHSPLASSSSNWRSTRALPPSTAGGQAGRQQQQREQLHQK